MICRLMVTDAGDKIWRAFFRTSPAKTPLAPETRHLLEETSRHAGHADILRELVAGTTGR